MPLPLPPIRSLGKLSCDSVNSMNADYPEMASSEARRREYGVCVMGDGFNLIERCFIWRHHRSSSHFCYRRLAHVDEAL